MKDNFINCLTPFCAAALLLAGCVTQPTLAPVGEFPLPSAAPEGLSGIAWTGNDELSELAATDGFVFVFEGPLANLGEMSLPAVLFEISTLF